MSGPAVGWPTSWTALAQVRGEPLLYKGDDFSKTDVRAVSDPH